MSEKANLSKVFYELEKSKDYENKTFNRPYHEIKLIYNQTTVQKSFARSLDLQGFQVLILFSEPKVLIFHDYKIFHIFACTMLFHLLAYFEWDLM